jgi:gene 40 protein
MGVSSTGGAFASYAKGCGFKSHIPDFNISVSIVVLNILEVDILNNFENDKDEICLECGTSELCGCNYSFDPDDETFDPYYDDVTDADDDLDDDDDYWSDSYDCGCCTCCGCTCSDDDWDDYYWNDYLDY